MVLVLPVALCIPCGGYRGILSEVDLQLLEAGTEMAAGLATTLPAELYSSPRVNSGTLGVRLIRIGCRAASAYRLVLPLVPPIHSSVN